ncbi:MAG: hypothetical protein KKB50_19780 [Planctomycetes bacterium]|nr:hypothetical protein [Planctomycetota bacterium]
MAKAIKALVLVLILVGLIVAYFITREEGQQLPTTPGGAEMKSDQAPVPVEEKYGFTSEGLDDG